MNRQYLCPNGHGMMEFCPNQALQVCPTCYWGVPDVELYDSPPDRISGRIRVKHIGHQYEPTGYGYGRKAS
jgi:hypothetical protein